jgi:xylan 1,4-beta-xylosidase
MHFYRLAYTYKKYYSMNKTIFILLLLISYPVQAQVTNPRTLPNEWGNYGIGDPYILKYKGIYYLYCSTRDDQVGVKVWSSWDLASWNYEGICTAEPITKGAYAPEVAYNNGVFYMYTSPGGNGHYILSSDNPTGPFVLRTGNLGHTIDGDVFTDDDGRMYFSHASPTGIQGNAMNSPISIDGPDVALNAYLNGWTEGSTIFKRNGLYYATYTGNHVFSRGYRVAYGTSTNPLGPYTPAVNNPIVLNTEGAFYGLGHSGSVLGPDLDTWYIAYHNLLGDGGQGPLRKLNIDPHGFNGTKMVVYGATNWTQPSPKLPAFYDRFDRANIGATWTNVNGGNWGMYNQELMWQDQVGTATWYKQINNVTSEVNYSAEFNLKEVSKGGNDARFGAVFSYIDDMNYATATFSSFGNFLETDFIVNGQSTAKQNVTLAPGWDYQKWHALRIEKNGGSFKIFVDDMLKSTRTNTTLQGGKIGLTTFDDHADFGYTAFNNQINGSGIFDFYKPIPGNIEAVHYNAGIEGVGYHDLTSNNIGGQYRNDGVDIAACSEGGFNIGWNSTGEWYAYDVNIQSSNTYYMGLRYATPNANTQVRILCDNIDVSGIITLPATGAFTNWQTYTIPKLSLPQGNHVLKVETITGEFDLYTYQFGYSAAVVSTTDNFNSGFSGAWNYSDGNWQTPSGTASLNSFGKKAIGNTTWLDYTVDVDIQCPASGNAGLMVRVKNPANGGANNDSQLGIDFYQGYFVGIQTGGVQLGKQNYDWKELNFKNQSLTAGIWYKLRAVVKGASIKIYLNDMTTPVIDYFDTDPILSGKAGLRVFNTQANFDNFNISFSDCNNTPNGIATTDVCGTCVGGTTGKITLDTDSDGIPDCVDPDQDNDGVLNADDCAPLNPAIKGKTIWYADTDGDGFGDPAVTQLACSKPTGYVADKTDACPTDANKKIAGNCGCNKTEQSCLDCVGIANGTAKVDVCGTCVGGTTGKITLDTDNDGIPDCVDPDQDNDGVLNADDCAPLDPAIKGKTVWYLDTDGDGFGDPAVSQMSCSKPIGYVADKTDACPTDPNKKLAGNCGCNRVEGSCLDCAGIINGTAVLDNCNHCVEGITGLQACEKDCHGDWGGTAVLDVCNECAGGNTGITIKTSLSQCATTGLDMSKPTLIKVYPNPFVNNCYIVISSKAEIEIVALDGNIVFKTTILESSWISPNIAPGYYFIRIQQDNNAAFQSLIKN